MQSYLYNLATDRYKGLLPGFFKFFLFFLSLIYGVVLKILIIFYRLRLYRLNCKVISVGNITLGGTGKTLAVEFIAKYLKQKSHRLAILTRGYKRKTSNFESFDKLRTLRRRTLSKVEVLRTPNFETMGDEPFMLQQNLKDVPVIVDADRIRSANLAIDNYAVDTVILDDGFQQWRIRKDLEIVTVDAANPFGNRHLLPRGILREPLSSLRRANIFIITKSNLATDMQNIKNYLAKINPQAEIFESRHEPLGFYHIDKPDELLSLDYLKAKTVALFSGIACPDSFENLVKSLDITVGFTFRFPDHHNYTKEDLDTIINNCRDKNIDTIVTTQKDAARIDTKKIFSHDTIILVLRIELAIQDEQRFYNRLLRLYSP